MTTPTLPTEVGQLRFMLDAAAGRGDYSVELTAFARTHCVSCASFLFSSTVELSGVGLLAWTHAPVKVYGAW